MKLLMLITKLVLKVLYKVETSGLEHVEASGERVLIVANHTSYLDGMLLALFLGVPISFATNQKQMSRWWVGFVKRSFPLLVVDYSDPMAMKTLIQYVKAGNKVVIFPEGRITSTGSLMKIYPSSGMVADKAKATILPVRIDGAQYSRFSLLKGQVRQRWFPKIKLTVQPPETLIFSEGMTSRERRQKAGEALENIMREMVFATSSFQMRLWDALLEAADVNGKKHEIIEDIERQPLSYSDVFTRSMVLQQLLAPFAKQGEHAGLLLPNVSSCYITFFALQARGVIPAMLNFSMGESATIAAIETASINTVFTSRRFVKAGELESLIAAIETKAKVVFLEDLRENLNIAHKIKGLVMAKYPWLGVRRLIKNVKPDDAAVILFTSGSEGIPKGVVLSHQNILANIQQVKASVSFNPTDICLNALPLFHSFGLTAGSLLSTFNGVKTFFYPSPLHYRVIPEVAYEINATIVFGTNVFLAAYAKHAHPYDFYCIRYAVAGAEKLQDETRETWMHKFGVRILEGYGATETSPILSVNTPMYYKVNTVGRFMPGIEYRLEHVPGISKGGRLYVRSPNVMKGYLLHEEPGRLQPPEDGWYDTGDIVDVDDEGFVSILGRAKRFAKIAGEMISLTAVEEMCKHCWPEHEHIALSFPDAGKGEKIVLMSTFESANRKALVEYAKEYKMNDLLVAKEFLYVSEVPLLGSGKIHYVAAQALAEKMFSDR